MGSKIDRIAELEILIEKYQASYYGGEAEISDGEFDILWDELKTLSPFSPALKKIGTDSNYSADGFPKARHLIPMGSQEKAANPQEFKTWAEKQFSLESKDMPLFSSPSFAVQYKLDGASIELQYKNGILSKAVTRGDGITGDDITPNVRRMKGVVPKLDVKFSGGIRGEVIMPRDVWKEKYKDKANCRNAANGLMRRKDGQGSEDLCVITYDACDPDNDNLFTDEDLKIKWLSKRGFKTTVTKVFSMAEEVIDYRQQVASLRDSLPFDIDGLVVKNINTDMADLRRARPEKQIAFKFDLETAFSILIDVEWSESGSTYTPVGIIEPVRLAGTTVKRASLNNPDMIRSMGLKIGSVVSVVKRGEIIPKIEGLAPAGALSAEKEQTEISLPKTCAVCKTKLVDAGTRLYCPNSECPKRLLHRLKKWVQVLDIRSLGDKLLLQLFEKNRVTHIRELYTLKTEELALFERMGELSAAKVIRHIMANRELSLSAFVAGFNLEGVAETTVEKIAAAGFDTLEKLRGAATADIASVHGLGEITAAVITEGLKECRDEMDAVLKTGLITIKSAANADTLPLRGKSFCFTGELKSMKRNQAEDKIKSLGAQAKSSVVKGLSYLVTRDPLSGSAKNKKAAELGVEIIDEDQFLALLK